MLVELRASGTWRSAALVDLSRALNTMIGPRLTVAIDRVRYFATTDHVLRRKLSFMHDASFIIQRDTST